MFEVGCGDGRLTHDRLERERVKQAEWRAKSAEGGRKSAKMRNGGAAVVQPPLQPPAQPNGNTPSSVSCLQSSSSLPVSSPDPVPPQKLPRAKRAAAASPSLKFDEFWKAYPKRLGRGDAVKAWQKHGCEKFADDILLKLAKLSISHDWTKDGGQFVPKPTTWLNREGWHDELPETRATSGKPRQTEAERDEERTGLKRQDFNLKKW